MTGIIDTGLETAAELKHRVKMQYQGRLLNVSGLNLEL